MADSDIEDSSPVPFHLEEWIGKNRKVPAASEIPMGLANHFSALQELPDNVKNEYYPGIHLNIETFLKYILPRHRYDLPGVSVMQCFSREDPNCADSIHVKRSIPPNQLVEKISTQFRQAVLDGMKSVVDPFHPDSRLPLWCVRYWKDMLDLHDIQEQWGKGLTWLENRIREAKSNKEMEIYTTAQRRGKER